MIIKDAKRVALVSYSIWAQVLGLVALIMPELLFGVWGIEANPYFLWWLGVGLTLFGIIGRFISQDGGFISNIWKVLVVAALLMLISYSAASAMGTRVEAPAPKADLTAKEAETLAIAIPFIEREEGMRLEAYLDIVGVPTICAGTTRGVKLGMRRTLEECRATLRAEVREYRLGLHRYFTPETIRTRLPPTRDAAFTSFAINVGIVGAGGSTATKRLNAADIVGACDALTWWNKAGQRVVRGLVLRRGREQALCLQGT